MSNSAVGNVYQQIIADVIEASRVDLEENGVDESILDELKQVSHPSNFLSHYLFFPVSQQRIIPNVQENHNGEEIR